MFSTSVFYSVYQIRELWFKIVDKIYINERFDCYIYTWAIIYLYAQPLHFCNNA